MRTHRSSNTLAYTHTHTHTLTLSHTQLKADTAPKLICLAKLPANSEITFDYQLEDDDATERPSELTPSGGYTEDSADPGVSCSGSSENGLTGDGVSTTQKLYQRLTQRAMRLGGLEVDCRLGFQIGSSR